MNFSIAIKKRRPTTFAQLGLFLLVFNLPAHWLWAQLCVNTKNPDPSSVFHAESPSRDKGILIPRLSLQDRGRIKNPAIGLMIYNMDNKCLETHSGAGEWKSLCGKCCQDENNIPDVTPTPPSSYKGDLSSCKSIKENYSDSKDGEYELTVSGQKFKTYCDMDHGGYTLIWSYSSETALDRYRHEGNANGQYVPGSVYAFSAKNTKTQGGINFPAAREINYGNYRVSKQAMEGIGMNSVKVVMTNNPKNPKDNLALNNYAESDGVTQLFNQNSHYASGAGKGKIEGKSFSFVNARGTIEGVGPIGNFMWAQAGDQPLHINIDGNQSTIPYGASQNVFGFFAEYSKTDLFGLCPVGQTYCASAALKPHPKDQERYIQWWLK